MVKIFQFMLILFLMMGVGVAFSQTGNPPTDNQMFTVLDVPMDKTAENAAIARQQALVEGQREAFKTLAGKLMSAEDFKNFTVPDDAVIGSMIEDFEVHNEQLSTTQYIATLTVTFKPDNVRSFFSSKNLAVSDVPSNPVLILPVYQEGKKTELWEDVNPWRAAWAAVASSKGAVPVYLPVGDIDDMAAVSAEKVMAGDYAPVFVLQKKYQARDVVVPVAHKAEDGTLLVDVYEYLMGDMNRIKTLTVPQTQTTDLFQDGVMAVTVYLQESWKEKTTLKTEDGKSVADRVLHADVSFSHIQQWVEIQNKLRGVDLITSSNVLSLNRDNAELEISYKGSQDDLIHAFISQGLSLAPPAVEINDAAPDSQDVMIPMYQIELLAPVTTVAPMPAPAPAVPEVTTP